MNNQKTKFKFIYIEITKKCNLKCPFCPSKDVSRTDYVSLESFKEIIEKIKLHTNMVYLHVLGEPLLHPNFKEIIEICNDNNIQVRITTNGTLLYRYDFSTININKINISLQALVNLNEDEQIKYLEYLKQFLMQIAHKLNNHQMGVELRLWNNNDDDKVQKQNLFIKEKLNEIVVYQSYPNVRIDEETEFEWPSLDSPNNETPFYCHGGQTHLAILTNGDVVMCCLDYLGHTKLGNIYQNSLSEIINSEPYTKVINNRNKPYFLLCQKCSYRNRLMSRKRGVKA